jgi:hypothetical protein
MAVTLGIDILQQSLAVEAQGEDVVGVPPGVEDSVAVVVGHQEVVDEEGLEAGGEVVDSAAGAVGDEGLVEDEVVDSEADEVDSEVHNLKSWPQCLDLRRHQLHSFAPFLLFLYRLSYQKISTAVSDTQMTLAHLRKLFSKGIGLHDRIFGPLQD